MSTVSHEFTLPDGSCVAGSEHVAFERISELTNRQMLFWLGQVLNPDLPVYNIIFTFRITGSLDPARFEAAIRAVIARHDALRSVIRSEDGVPCQGVLHSLDFDLEVIDLSAAADPDAAYLAFLSRRKQKVFDLGRQLFDTALVRLGATAWVWYLNQHHIMTDGWTMALLFQQVSAHYQAQRPEVSSEASSEVITTSSFHDYVAREIQGRSSPSYKNAEAYRLEKLSAPLSPISYYAGLPHPRTNAEHRLSFPLGVERTRLLKALAQREDMPTQRLHQSLFNLFVSALFVYLNRISGNETVSVGMVFHNRLTPDDQVRMGMFVNLFPLQVRLGEDDTLHSVIEKTMLEWYAALRYGPYCISNPGRQQAYDVLINYLPMTYADFAGLPTRTVWEHSGYGDGNHSLSVHVEDFNARDDITLHLDFNEGVFTPADQERARTHFLHILDAFLADTGTTLGAIRLLSEEDWAARKSRREQQGDRLPRPSYTPPRTETQRKLAALWQATLGVAEVGLYDDFFNLGGHSLLAVRLFAQIEQTFMRRLPLITLFQAPTIAALATHLDSRPSLDAPTLIPLQPLGKRPPLFCVPPGASSVIGFAALAKYMAPDQPVYGLEPLGVGADEKPHQRVEEMAAFYIDEMKTVQPRGPYHLLGSCLGGWVVLEMAHQLLARGEQVGLLALLDTVDPPALRSPSATSHPGVRKPRRRYLRRIRYHLQQGDFFSALARKAIRWLFRRLRPLKRAPQVQRAHWMARNRYVTTVYPGRITMLVATDSEGFESKWPDRKENWARMSTEEPVIAFIPGTHATAHKEPHVRALAELLKDMLHTAQHEAR